MSNWNTSLFGGDSGFSIINPDLQTAEAMMKMGEGLYGMPARFAQLDAANNQADYLMRLQQEFEKGTIPFQQYEDSINMMGVSPFQRANNYVANEQFKPSYGLNLLKLLDDRKYQAQLANQQIRQNMMMMRMMGGAGGSNGGKILSGTDLQKYAEMFAQMYPNIKDPKQIIEGAYLLAQGGPWAVQQAEVAADTLKKQQYMKILGDWVLDKFGDNAAKNRAKAQKVDLPDSYQTDPYQYIID